MAYTVQVIGKFVFTDTSTTLHVEGLQLDLKTRQPPAKGRLGSPSAGGHRFAGRLQ
jgi:hypothetical protein